MRRLACCTRDREISLDFDEHERVMTYNGLESCILNSFSYDNESSISRVDGCASDSLDEDGSSCSSSKDAFGSFSSQWLVNKQEEHQHDDLEVSSSLKCFHPREKPSYTIQLSDVEIMKERFAKLLLGEDVTGGRKGLCTALALSNAITNLGASVFGELWKLEPLPEERKRKWRREMDWLLSPTNYMVELVPAKQNSANGRTLEIMTPKARADIHLNLPALQKLDSMLLDTLDSMVNTEFWYAEGVSRAEGRSMTTRQSKRWWLPSPQVPPAGLSIPERKKLLYQGKVVQQVFKAAKSINEDVLLEIPVPSIIQDALPKSGKANLGEELHQVLTAELSSVEEMINSLNLKGEHGALEAVNRLEAAVLAWKQRINEQNSGLSPVRNSWSFMKDPCSELDKMEMLSDRAEALLHMLKTRYPNLPQSFLDVTKVQYNKDVGRSILEAYSRILGSIAFRIISRIGDILQEDVLMNPESPVATCLPGENLTWIPKSPVVRDCIRYSLIDQMNKADIISFDSSASKDPDLEFSDNEVRPYPVTAAHFRSRSRIWCIGREACNSVSSTNSP